MLFRGSGSRDEEHERESPTDYRVHEETNRSKW
jgi:hypothetical protein